MLPAANYAGHVFRLMIMSQASNDASSWSKVDCLRQSTDTEKKNIEAADKNENITKLEQLPRKGENEWKVKSNQIRTKLTASEQAATAIANWCWTEAVRAQAAIGSRWLTLRPQAYKLSTKADHIRVGPVPHRTLAHVQLHLAAIPSTEKQIPSF